MFHRVEGLSGVAEPVIITDVVYATETKPLRKEGEGEDGNGEYERLKSVIEEKQKELKHLEFKATVLEEERRLLEQFAGHVTKVSHRKVHVHVDVYVQYVCIAVVYTLILIHLFIYMRIEGLHLFWYAHTCA